MKERTLKLCSSYQLDTVQETLISKELKRIYSNLFLGPMLEYAAITSILRYGHFLPKSAIPELEAELEKCIWEVRNKVISGCAKATE